jgi:hypothetical protein
MIKNRFAICMICFLGFFLSGCSWTVFLVIANNSKENITVEYRIPAAKEKARFYADPKTYRFSPELAKALKSGKKLSPVATKLLPGGSSQDVILIIEPGNAVNIGCYYSIESRDETIANHQLVLKIGTGFTSGFHHWSNINTDLLQID